MHLHSGCVANDFEDEAAEHTARIGPCPPFEAEGELYDQDEGEQGEVECVASERRHVIDCGEGEGAGFDGAEVGVVEEGGVESGEVELGDGVIFRHLPDQ